MFKPHTLTILTTDQCTARCSHCSVSSGPKLTDKVSFEQMKSAIEELAGMGHLSTVIFAGGEPTLLKEQLLDAIAHANLLNLNTRLITNASWAINPKKARKRLKEFRAAGLVELNISMDEFHEPYIPIENPIHAWNASKGLGFRSVVIATHSTSGVKYSAERIKQLIGEDVEIIGLNENLAERDLAPAPDGTQYCISIGMLQKIGRAARELSDDDFEWYSLDELDSGGCDYMGNNPALSPRNSLLSCCGVEANRNLVLDFGLLREGAAASILMEKAANDPIKAAISCVGPTALAKLARFKNPKCGVQTKYTSVCHVCEHVTSSKRIRETLQENREDVLKLLVVSGAQVT